MASRRQHDNIISRDKYFFVFFGFVQLLIGIGSFVGFLVFFLKKEMTSSVQFCGYSSVALVFCGILSLFAGCCHSLRFLFACICIQVITLIAAIVGISTTVTSLKHKSLIPPDIFALTAFVFQIFSPVVFAFFLIFPIHRNCTSLPTSRTTRPPSRHSSQLIDSTSV